MAKKSKITLLVFFLFFSVYTVFAQTIQQEKPTIAAVLSILETRYNISFSYADKNLSNKKIKIPDANLSLNDALDVIKSQTNLYFEILDNRFIVIRRRSDNDALTPTTQKLEEVLITNYLTKGISKNNSGNVTLKPDEFGILPGLIEPDVLQIVQALPGVLSVDETVSNINVRGGTNDQNLLLWDGIKMYNSGHFFGLISAFNPYLTKEVTVSKNGTSAKYGDGISSIIDMKLSNTLSDKTDAAIGVNLINVDGFAIIPVSKKMEVQLSARRSTTDIFYTPTYQQYFERAFQDTDLINNQINPDNTITTDERFYFYDVAAKFLYDISKTDKLRVSFLNVFNTLDFEERSTNVDSNETLNNKLTQQNLAVGIEHTKQWNPKFSTNTSIYLSNYNLDAKDINVNTNQRLIQENEVSDIGVKINGVFVADENIKLDFGYQFNEVSISDLEDVTNPDFRRFTKNVSRTHVIFGEAQFRSLNKKTLVRVGLRTNYFEKFSEVLTEPRFAFNQKLSNTFQLEILGEFKSQITSQIIDLQNDFLGIEKRRWVLADNVDIPITESKQFSIGLNYNKNGLFISAEVFIKDVDGITARSQGFQNQYQFVNAIGSYNVNGIDFLINKQFNAFSTWLSYSFSDNNYKFNDLNDGISFPNNVDIEHAITFASTYTIKNLKVALGLNWHTGKPTTTPQQNSNIVNNTIIFNTANSERLNDYLRTDFSAIYKLKLNNKLDLETGISVWNIFDKKNIINSYYIVNDNNEIKNVENQSLGITPNFSVRLDF